MTRIITLSETTDPSTVAGQAILYAKSVDGVTQFFVRDGNGEVVQLSSGDPGWYGTGVEGDETTAGAGGGDVAFTEDRFFNNYTITAGDTISTNGYRLHCAGTLTIQSTAFLDHSGSESITGAPTGTLIGGTDGGTGSVFDGPGGTEGADNAYYPSKEASPSGGTGGGGGFAGGTSRPQLGYGSYTIESIATGHGTGGGSGGGGGVSAGTSSGGHGGGGGGVMVICARHIVAASGSIRCRGGSGSDSLGGDGGGGGGGTGGVVFIVTDDATTPTVDVAGGVGGTGNAGNGAAGSDGVLIAISPLHGPL
jgi:hypothetical protein